MILPMMKTLQETTSGEERQTFQTLCQKRAENILLSPELWDRFIAIQKREQ